MGGSGETIERPRKPVEVEVSRCELMANSLHLMPVLRNEFKIGFPLNYIKSYKKCLSLSLRTNLKQNDKIALLSLNGHYLILNRKPQEIKHQKKWQNTREMPTMNGNKR